MKKFNAGEWVLLMLAFSVSLTIFTGILGVVLKGSVTPSEGATAVRTALIDLLKYIVAGLLSVLALILSKKKDDEKDQPQ